MGLATKSLISPFHFESSSSSSFSDLVVLGGLLLCTLVNGVSWRVLNKLSLTWLTGDSGPFLRFFLEFPPIVYRLVRFPLAVVQGFAGLIFCSRVKMMKKKMQEFSGRCSRRMELKVMYNISFMDADSACRQNVLVVNVFILYVCNGASPPTFEVAGGSPSNGDICTRVQTSVLVVRHFGFVMEVLLPP